MSIRLSADVRAKLATTTPNTDRLALALRTARTIAKQRATARKTA